MSDEQDTSTGGETRPAAEERVEDSNQPLRVETSDLGADPLDTAGDTEDGYEDEEEDLEAEGEEVDQPFRADDPLAPAFDLELGEPISPEPEGDGLPWQNRVKSAKEFLNTELIYRYDVLEPEHRKQLAGTFRVDLKGDQGGSWTITLGDDIRVENVSSDAEVSLAMSHNDFVSLVNGDLNPQLAILAKKVRIHGDLRRAITFQNLLVPNND